MERKEKLRRFLSATKALLESMRYSIDSADPTNVWKYISYKTFLRKYMDLAKAVGPLLAPGTNLYLINVDKVEGSGDTIAFVQKEYFDIAYSNTILLKSLLESELGYAEDEMHKLVDFIRANLRKAVFGTAEREVEIQNALEALIVGRGMSKGSDYDRETGRVKTSGKEFIPDFIFPQLQLCLEVKLVKTSEKLKAIVDEINADIRAYGTRYDRQLYVVYDVGNVRDETEFKRDLENALGVTVLVIKH